MIDIVSISNGTRYTVVEKTAPQNPTSQNIGLPYQISAVPAQGRPNQLVTQKALVYGPPHLGGSRRYRH